MTDHSCSRSLTDSKMPTNGRHLYGESHYLGVGPADSKSGPARGAAQDIRKREQLEGEVVVGFLERTGEILEIRPASRRRSCLCSGRRRRAAPSAALAIKIAPT